MRYTIPDGIDEAARNLLKRNGGKPLTDGEIKKETLEVGLKHGEHWQESSIMPYDFCHNTENVGSRPQAYRIFNRLPSGLYEYVGRKVYKAVP